MGEHLGDGVGGGGGGWGGVGGICAFGRCGADVAWACGRSCVGVDLLFVGGGGDFDCAYGRYGGPYSGNVGSRVSLQSSSFSVKSMGNKE